MFLASDENPEAQVELTYNWDPELYTGGRNFGHLAYSVSNIYETCQRLMDKGVTINRPRSGRMAFVKSPDGISIELLQQGDALPRRSRGSRCRTSGAGERRGRGRPVDGGGSVGRSDGVHLHPGEPAPVLVAAGDAPAGHGRVLVRRARLVGAAEAAVGVLDVPTGFTVPETPWIGSLKATVVPLTSVSSTSGSSASIAATTAGSSAGSRTGLIWPVANPTTSPANPAASASHGGGAAGRARHAGTPGTRALQQLGLYHQGWQRRGHDRVVGGSQGEVDVLQRP